MRGGDFHGGKKLFGFLSLFVICIVLVACGVEGKTEVQLLKEMPKAKTMTIDPSLSKMEATEMVHAAQRFMHFGIQVKRSFFRRLLRKIFSIIRCQKGDHKALKG